MFRIIKTFIERLPHRISGRRVEAGGQILRVDVLHVVDVGEIVAELQLEIYQPVRGAVAQRVDNAVIFISADGAQLVREAFDAVNMPVLRAVDFFQPCDFGGLIRIITCVDQIAKQIRVTRIQIFVVETLHLG